MKIKFLNPKYFIKKTLDNLPIKYFSTTNTEVASNDSLKEILNSTFSKSEKKIETFKDTTNSLLNQKLKIKSKEEISQEYEDKLFYLKFQWARLQKDKIKYKQDYLSRDFNDHQMQEIKIVLNIVKHFNQAENLLFSSHVENLLQAKSKKKIATIKDTPSYDPNFESYQTILKALRPFLSSGYFLKGSNNVAQTAEPAKKVEVKEPEKPKEKAIVNVKLMGFDPAKKIGLIKECRNIFTLGLKEAKEMVEKENNVIKTNVKREEALELKKKLEEAGGKVELD